MERDRPEHGLSRIPRNIGSLCPEGAQPVADGGGEQPFFRWAKEQRPIRVSNPYGEVAKSGKVPSQAVTS